MQSRCRALCAAVVATLLGALWLFGSARPALAVERPASAELPGALLSRGAGFEHAAGSQEVRLLQLRLRRLGYRPGPVDGLFGGRTQAAVVAFQRARGLAADGVVGAATKAQLARNSVPSSHVESRGNAGGARGGGAGSRGHSLNRGSGPAARTRERPVESAAGDGGGVGVLGWLAAAVMAALAVGLSARLFCGRPAVATASPDFVASGRLGGARFSGRVLSLAVSPRGRERTWLLVADDERGTAIWVERGQVDGLEYRPAAASSGRLAATGEASTTLGWVPDNGRTARRNGTSAGGDTELNAGAEPATVVEPSRPSGSDGASADLHPSGHNGRRRSDNGTPAVEHNGHPPDGSGCRPRAFGYLTGAEQSQLAQAERRRLEAACGERGWTLSELANESERRTGKRHGRPALDYALERIAAGEAELLLVARAEQLGRSLVELATVAAWLTHRGGRLVCLEPQIDTATPAGQTALQVIAAIGAWERNKLAERTRKGLAAARANRAVVSPTVDDRPELKRRIVAMRADGMTLQAIADQLNREEIPTLRGGKEWRPSSVQAAVGYKRPRRHQTGPSTNGHTTTTRKTHSLAT